MSSGSAGVPAKRDAYGQEIWHCYRGVSNHEIIERDDGFIDIGSAAAYFQPYENWPIHEREAIQRARGRVLDIGCGAGRVALHLEASGHAVLAIDNSPMAVKVAKLRGVKSARVLPIEAIQSLRGPFATIVLFGNNFGLLGGMTKARRLLSAMDRITTAGAVILLATADPYATREPVHRMYHRRNRERGRMGGQIRLRVRYREFQGNWFDYLFASRDEVAWIVEKTAWTVAEFVQSPGPGFVAVLEKRVQEPLTNENVRESRRRA